MIAYIFPGQSSHYAGMGRALAEDSEIAAEVFRVVDGALGFSLTDIMFGDDADALLPTQIQQPAILAHGVAAFAALRKRHDAGPAIVAGHSLGEYSALVAAGCMELADAVRLVSTRGEIMGRIADESKGAMAAVIGMSAEEVDALVRDASAAGTLVVANYNCPGQIVISGSPEAISAARDLARERGARAILLKVSGAFHSPLMAPAAEELTPCIEAAHMRDAIMPVVCNVDATPRTDAAALREALVAQVTSGVRWEESIRRMIAEGADVFIEVGPGKVLSKMMPRIDDGVTVCAVSDMAEAHACLEALG